MVSYALILINYTCIGFISVVFRATYVDIYIALFFEVTQSTVDYSFFISLQYVAMVNRNDEHRNFC